MDSRFTHAVAMQRHAMLNELSFFGVHLVCICRFAAITPTTRRQDWAHKLD